MDETLSLHVGKWKLTLAPKSFVPSILSLIGRLAMAESLVFIADGGNQFNVLEIAEAVNGDEEILEKISGSRAFTCYQMESLLQTTTKTNALILILDFLATFYDESVPFADRSRLFKKCLTHIHRLSLTNKLLIIVHPPAVPSLKTTGLIKELQNAADECLSPDLIKKYLENIGNETMGKTIPSFAQVFDKIQSSFSNFRRALRRPDQLAIDDLFVMARKHLSAGGLASHPLPFLTILFCMILELYKEIKLLRELVNKLKSSQNDKE